MNTYRKFYKDKLKEFGFDLPKDWDIHHIDHNRENNSIINLVAIPKILHRKYHFQFTSIEQSYVDKDVLYPKKKISINQNITDIYPIELLEEHIKKMNKLNKIKDEIRIYILNRNDIFNIPMTECY